MRILVACEFSGRVRDAFIAHGHDAISCDLIESETPGPHKVCDVRDMLGYDWDMMIAFPPCTYICRSGFRWHYGTKNFDEALDFVYLLMRQKTIPRIAIENPHGAISTHIRKPTQVIHPYEHGHAEIKPTCLWLKGLPKLEPSNMVTAVPSPRVHREAPGPDRWKNRSRTYPGIAEAMANQWGTLLE